MDAVCFKSGISGIVPSMLIGDSLDVISHPSQVSAGGGSENGRNNRMVIDNAVLVDYMEKKTVDEGNESGPEDQNLSWFFKSWSVNSMWTGKQGNVEVGNEEIEGQCPIDDRRNGSGDYDDGCNVCIVHGDECGVCSADDYDEAYYQFDRDSFSRMLRRASLTEARLYAQLSYLGNLASSIPKIKPENLLSCHCLRFVTSSLDNTKPAATIGKKEASASADAHEVETNEREDGERNDVNNKCRMDASVTYQTASSTVNPNFRNDEVGGDSLDGSSDINSVGGNMHVKHKSIICEGYSIFSDRSGCREGGVETGCCI